MIAGEAFVTPHAVRAFQERIAPLTYEQALGAIVRELAENVISVKTGAHGFIARTRGGRFCFRAVICGGDPAPVVKTILRSGK